VIRTAETDEKIENCFDVMSELRTHLKREDFLTTIQNMEKDGYRLAYIEEQGIIVAVAGYRIASNLFMGKHLYVDDLVTSEQARSIGHGEQLLKWG